jgi:hypothetical protein
MKRYLLAVAAVALTFNLSAVPRTAAIPVGVGPTGTFNASLVSGNFTPGGSFTLGLSLNFVAAGANMEGISYYFADLANTGFFGITQRDVTGSEFNDLITPALSYPQSLGPAGNASDLGALSQTLGGVGSGNHFISFLTFSIAPGAMVGSTYTLSTLTAGTHRSIFSDSNGDPFVIPEFGYRFTIDGSAPTTVPEGGWTLALLGVAAGSLVCLRRRMETVEAGALAGTRR